MGKKHLIIEGLLAGIVVFETIIMLKMRKTSGTLLIDTKTERDLYRFDVDDLNSLSNKKFIRLRVNNDADLSR